ncbi:MAG: hypothetical protein JXR84_08000 [Anaerolineae bacterium]|nr:hypothetical protein [Anaerolineae bacterium]
MLREDPSGLTVNVGAIEVSISGAQCLTTTYYFAGGQRIAMREGGEVTYLHGDYLGSASLATDESGAKLSEMRRIADDAAHRRRCGHAVWRSPVWGCSYGSFTGQREEAGIGLHNYGARFPTLTFQDILPSLQTVVRRVKIHARSLGN